MAFCAPTWARTYLYIVLNISIFRRKPFLRWSFWCSFLRLIKYTDKSSFFYFFELKLLLYLMVFKALSFRIFKKYLHILMEGLYALFIPYGCTLKNPVFQSASVKKVNRRLLF